MIKPNEFERHIILYCKAWYKETNLIDDIRSIISNISGSELQYINIGHVYRFLTQITINYVEKYCIKEFFDNLFKYNENPDSVTIEEVCGKLACEISIIDVEDEDEIFIDLGEPDYSILDRKEVAIWLWNNAHIVTWIVFRQILFHQPGNVLIAERSLMQIMRKRMFREYMEVLLLTVLWEWRAEGDGIINNSKKARRVRI